MDGVSDKDPYEAAVFVIAQYLDRPSIYMGGPSERSRRKAEDIVGLLRVNDLAVQWEETA